MIHQTYLQDTFGIYIYTNTTVVTSRRQERSTRLSCRLRESADADLARDREEAMWKSRSFKARSLNPSTAHASHCMQTMSNNICGSTHTHIHKSLRASAARIDDGQSRSKHVTTRGQWRTLVIDSMQDCSTTWIGDIIGSTFFRRKWSNTRSDSQCWRLHSHTSTFLASMPTWTSERHKEFKRMFFCGIQNHMIETADS